MNRKLLLRAGDTAALVAICTSAGIVALKLGVMSCGAGMLALGAAFLAGDLWPIVRRSLRAPTRHRESPRARLA